MERALCSYGSKKLLVNPVCILTTDKKWSSIPILIVDHFKNKTKSIALIRRLSKNLKSSLFQNVHKKGLNYFQYTVFFNIATNFNYLHNYLSFSYITFNTFRVTCNIPLVYPISTPFQGLCMCLRYAFIKKQLSKPHIYIAINFLGLCVY